MPFDPLGFEDIQVPVVKPFDFETATPDERLLELARNLDREGEWRNHRLVWDFAVVRAHTQEGCGTAGCALGVAAIIFPRFKTLGLGYFSSAQEAFALNKTEVMELFNSGLPTKLGILHEDVTPGMVATAIREFVANRSA